MQSSPIHDFLNPSNVRDSSVVKSDPEHAEVKVAESTSIDLVTVDGQLLGSNVVSYLDPTPVVAKMQELMVAVVEAQETPPTA